MDKSLAVLSGRLCIIDECVNEAQRGGLCWGHLKRRTQCKPVSAKLKNQYESPDEVLQEAAINYADMEAEASAAAFKRAWDRLRMAAIRYGRKSDAARINTSAALPRMRARRRVVSAFQLKLFP